MATHHYSYSTSFPLWTLIVLMLVPIQLDAQISNTHILQIKSFYDELAFVDAITLADSIQTSGQALLPEEAAFLHQYTALSFYSLGELDSAHVHFLSLLSVRPNIELDPGETSPKILEFVDRVKQELPRMLDASENIQFTRYVVVEDLRRAATWRSALFPGWGQFYKGQQTRGLLLGGAFWVGLGTTLYAISKEDQAKQVYGDAISSADIESSFSEYNTWYKRRRNLALASLVLWAISAADANLTSYQQPVIPTATVSHGNEVLVGLELRF